MVVFNDGWLRVIEAIYVMVAFNGGLDGGGGPEFGIQYKMLCLFVIR